MQEDDREEILPLLLGDWETSPVRRIKVYAMAHTIVMACKYPDPYEPNPETERSLGSDGAGTFLSILWCENFWTIENLLLLLHAAESRRLRLLELEEDLRDPTHFADVGKEEEVRELYEGIDEHMTRISKWPLYYRDNLLIFLILFSLHVDTRAERACYKYSTVHQVHRLLSPRSAEILSLRRGFFSVAQAYLSNRLSHVQFRKVVNTLRILGGVSIKGAKNPPECALFRPELHNGTEDAYRIIAMVDCPEDISPAEESNLLQFPIDMDL